MPFNYVCWRDLPCHFDEDDDVNLIFLFERFAELCGWEMWLLVGCAGGNRCVLWAAGVSSYIFVARFDFETLFEDYRRRIWGYENSEFDVRSHAAIIASSAQYRPAHGQKLMKRWLTKIRNSSEQIVHRLLAAQLIDIGWARSVFHVTVLFSKNQKINLKKLFLGKLSLNTSLRWPLPNNKIHLHRSMFRHRNIQQITI